MTGYQWLEDLKVGDEVFVEDSLRRVERLTATQVLVGGSRFNRRNGRKIGASGWRSVYLREPTPERKREVHTARLRQWARYGAPSDLLTLTIEQIERVHALVQGIKQEGTNGS